MSDQNKTPGDPAAQHESEARRAVDSDAIGCAVLTISDSRTGEDDVSGQVAVDLLLAAGHRVANRDIVTDDTDRIRGTLESWLRDNEVDVVITTGGTGVGRRDGTIEVVRSLLTTELEGFGELFRMLSYEQVKSAAMLSRAVGGLIIHDDPAVHDAFLFALPGSPNAVRLALSKLIVPQLVHLVWHRKGDG